MTFEIPEGLVCDTCGAPATMIHLLPWCVRTERVELTGNCDCNPGGYAFPIREWAIEFSDDEDRHFTMRDQLRWKGGPVDRRSIPPEEQPTTPEEIGQEFEKWMRSDEPMGTTHGEVAIRMVDEKLGFTAVA